MSTKTQKTQPLSRIIFSILITRLFLPLLLISLVAIAAIQYYAYRQVQRELLNHTQSMLDVTNAYIQAASDLIDTLTLYSKTADNESMDALFDAVTHANPSFDALYLLAANSKVIALSPMDGSRLGMDMSQQPFYQPALNLPELVASQPFLSWRTGEPTIFLAQDINHQKMIVAELNLSALQRAIDYPQFAKNQTISFITDAHGNILAHPKQELVRQQAHWDGIERVEVASAQDRASLYIHRSSDHMLNTHFDLLTAADMRATGWYIISLTPISNLITPYAYGLAVVLISILVILIFVVRSIMKRLHWYVGQPLSQLSRVTHSIAQGDRVNYPISQTLDQISMAVNEIETLKNDFKQMDTALKKRENALQNSQGELQRLNDQLEERVAERTAQLEHATHEIESFSYSVSHDLRAPLRHINGYTQILKDSYGQQLDERGRQLLELAHLASERMAELIDALLTLSRISRNELRPARVDLSALSQEIVTELQASDPSRNVEWQIQAGINAFGDPSMLRIVMTNLLSNAWKFSTKTHLAQVVVRTQQEGSQTVYAVQDNGAGFDMRYADKLFGAFQRLHSESEFEGTGIGLALVQRIILRHGGNIWAEATPGKGAVFYFTLKL